MPGVADHFLQQVMEQSRIVRDKLAALEGTQIVRDPSVGLEGSTTAEPDPVQTAPPAAPVEPAPVEPAAPEPPVKTVEELLAELDDAGRAE